MGPKRITFLVLTIGLAGIVALVAVLGSGGESGGSSSISVRQAPTLNGVEVLVTVPDEINVPDTADGEELIDVVCLNASGTSIVRSRQPWPFAKDGEPPAAHAHLPVSPEELRSIARCKVLGTEPELAAKLGLGR